MTTVVSSTVSGVSSSLSVAAADAEPVSLSGEVREVRRRATGAVRAGERLPRGADADVSPVSAVSVVFSVREVVSVAMSCPFQKFLPPLQEFDAVGDEQRVGDGGWSGDSAGGGHVGGS